MSKLDRNRSARLLEVLRPYRHIVVLTHDNPDPDAIASGWALKLLVESKLDRSTRLVGGGVVVRAENARMLQVLRPPLELVEELAAAPDEATILIDCSPAADNHLLRERRTPPTAVIDHHESIGRRMRLRYRDIRPRVAASASIVASYLQQQHIEPSPDLATALVYGLRTETRGWEAVLSRLDREMTVWLTGYVDQTKLTEIENAPLTRHYFSDLVLALGNTLVYENAAVCFLPRASGPEIIGEVADLLMRCQGIERVICGAVIDSSLLVSTRTSRTGGNALYLVEQALKGLGRGGGHRHRAGGKVGEAGRNSGDTEQLQARIRKQWLAACGIDRRRGTRLISRGEVFHYLT